MLYIVYYIIARYTRSLTHSNRRFTYITMDTAQSLSKLSRLSGMLREQLVGTDGTPREHLLDVVCGAMAATGCTEQAVLRELYAGSSPANENRAYFVDSVFGLPDPCNELRTHGTQPISYTTTAVDSTNNSLFFYHLF